MFEVIYCQNSLEIQKVNTISERLLWGQRIYTVSGRMVHGASGGVVLTLSHQVVGVIRCGPVTIEETDGNANYYDNGTTGVIIVAM